MSSRTRLHTVALNDQQRASVSEAERLSLLQRLQDQQSVHEETTPLHQRNQNLFMIHFPSSLSFVTVPENVIVICDQLAVVSGHTGERS